MTYAERRVAPGVDLWTSSGAPGVTRILPDGCLDLLWDGERLLVAGPDPVARLHSCERSTPMLGVRLHGGRGPAALGVRADELTGRTVALADVWGDRRARAFVDLLRADGGALGALGALGGWAARVEPEPFGDRLCALLARGHGVAAAAERLGWSARQLQRGTRTTFGYGPAHLLRVLRLQRALALLDGPAPLGEVAQAAGYADQAHLSREVRALGGTTPSALRAERVRSVQDATRGQGLASRS